jgi:hypothetical protein
MEAELSRLTGLDRVMQRVWGGIRQYVTYSKLLDLCVG